MSARETIRFHARLQEDQDGFSVTEIEMYRRRTKENLGHFRDGAWSSSPLTKAELDRVFATIEAATTSTVFLEQFEGVVLEDARGNSYDL